MGDLGDKLKEMGNAVIVLEGEDMAAGELKNIGKPCKFTAKTDPKGRIAAHIKHKMNIIDLVPCEFSIGLGPDSTNDSQGADTHQTKLEKLQHTLKYNKPIDDYKALCAIYNIDPYMGVRLYTTDDTVSTDEFRNSYEENIIQSGLNQLSQYGRSIKGAAKSAGLTGQLNDAAKSAGNTASNYVESIAGKAPEFLKNVSSSVADILVNGNSVSMPKVWGSSTYQPSNSVVISLVSPYGSHKAIHEFIIKPLTYLLLLTLPKTNDGISYGFPHTVSFQAYGISEISIAAIAGLTLQRGGNDTSFNKYKQPLSINVSLEMINLVDGAASFKIPEALESTAISKSLKIQNENGIFIPPSTTLLQTPGKIIQSLSPVDYNDLTKKDLALTGEFENEKTTPPSQIESASGGGSGGGSFDGKGEAENSAKEGNENIHSNDFQNRPSIFDSL